MILQKDEILFAEFQHSVFADYVEFLQESLHTQYDILSQEPREADLTQHYIDVLEVELAKFTEHACEICANNADRTRHDEHNGMQWFCEMC